MQELEKLFSNNRIWSQNQKAKDPKAFLKIAEKQSPKYLWIGCADSRIPPNEILGLEPGELLVHRNVANVVPHTDFNSLSVLQAGIDCFGVEHVIVCGHYGCGGIGMAVENEQLGLIDNWLRHVKDVYLQEKEELDRISDIQRKCDRLAELNVLHQVKNICHTTIVQNAWADKKNLCIHGWIYDISTGLLKDLNCSVSSQEGSE